MEFHYVDLRCFCYATEDEDRVERALRWYLPDGATVDRTTSEGHYGDEIAVLSSRCENADDVRAIFGRVTEAPGWATVTTEVGARVDDDCAFHLGLDKQAALSGEPELGDGIQLAAKVEAYPASHENAVAAVHRSFDIDG